jgi:hypothetical protein
MSRFIGLNAFLGEFVVIMISLVLYETVNFLLLYASFLFCILSASDTSCDKYEDGDTITADYK